MDYSYSADAEIISMRSHQTNNQSGVLMSVDLVIKQAQKYYKDIQGDPNGRYKSWQQCYKLFSAAREESNPDYDHLTLMLAFYLASWGMYRGSSFLLQKDYAIHEPVVEELLDKKYDPLAGIKCSDYRHKDNQELLEEINSFLKSYYNGVRISVKGDTVKNDISDVLVTKVLMGTLACVPAYDRYFVAGVKNQKATTGQYNLRSLLGLADYYDSNTELLEAARKEMIFDGITYPQMKLLTTDRKSVV